ncbi:MAG TPA: hypothetical protein VFM55_13710, partial [Micromonosporaceae bacterium]|nr:hypothetical protein [Micromonosporaceae bacterium]
PTLPLIQMREDRLELRREHLPGLLHDGHTTATNKIPRSYGLFFCKPLRLVVDTPVRSGRAVDVAGAALTCPPTRGIAGCYRD